MADAVVIGAGIGGLTAGVALARSGWNVTVVERAPALEAVGAGLGVAPNALHALDALGLGDALRSRAAIQRDAGIRRSDGRWIYRTSDAAIRRRFGDPLVVTLRSDLVDVLVAALPPGALRLGTTVYRVDAARGAVTLADGSTLTGDLVVAADGVRSPTRSAAFPEHPAAEVPIVAWRFLAPRPAGLVPPRPGVSGPSSASSRSLTTGSTSTRPPGCRPGPRSLPCPRSTAGTTPSPTSWPRRATCSTLGCSSSSGRSAPCITGASPWSATPRTR